MQERMAWSWHRCPEAPRVLLAVLWVLVGTALLPPLSADEPLPEAAAPLSARVRAVVGPDPQRGLPARIDAAHALRGKSLDAGEIKALWDFVSGTAKDAGLPLDRFNHLRNDILTVLVQHTPVVPDLGPRLRGMYGDETRDRTWRDYCIQFLGQAYPRLDAAERADAAETLFAAARLHTVPTAGTALIALSNNLAAPGIDRDRVADTAVAIAADPEASPGACMSAFAVCARLRVAEALPHVREAAAGKGIGSITARMAAIAALGVLGDGSDRELLLKLGDSRNSRLRVAARSALRRLETNTGQGATD